MAVARWVGDLLRYGRCKRFIAGRTKQWFRVFGTGGTGDHSLGLGASALGELKIWMVLWPGPVAIGVITPEQW